MSRVAFWHGLRGTQGVYKIPAPPANAATAFYFLNANLQWQIPDLSPASPVAIYSVSIAFTDGDTWRRVSISNAEVSSASLIIGTVTRPTTTTDNDIGLTYSWSVASLGSGTFDLDIAAIGWGNEDPVGLVNETVTFSYIVG